MTTFYAPGDRMDIEPFEKGLSPQEEIDSALECFYMVNPGWTEVILVLGTGRTYYLHSPHREDRVPHFAYCSELFEYVPDKLEDAFNRIIDEHGLNITCIENDAATSVADYLYDVALGDATVLPAGAKPWRGSCDRL